MYLTYEEYSNMGGTVDETAFTRLELKARKFVDYQTFGRVKYGLNKQLFTLDEEDIIKYCMYELILAIKETSASSDGSKEVVSVSNDGVSESYRTFSLYDTKSMCSNIIVQYLSDVYLEELPVLYIGADELPKVVDGQYHSI